MWCKRHATAAACMTLVPSTSSGHPFSWRKKVPLMHPGYCRGAPHVPHAGGPVPLPTLDRDTHTVTPLPEKVGPSQVEVFYHTHHPGEAATLATALPQQTSHYRYCQGLKLNGPGTHTD